MDDKFLSIKMHKNDRPVHFNPLLNGKNNYILPVVTPSCCINFDQNKYARSIIVGKNGVERKRRMSHKHKHKHKN